MGTGSLRDLLSGFPPLWMAKLGSGPKSLLLGTKEDINISILKGYPISILEGHPYLVGCIIRGSI